MDRRSWIPLLALLAGCGGEAPPAETPPVEEGCGPGSLTLADGSCQPAGIPPELCAPGWEPTDTAGCEPILPAEPCAPGLMAIPGETECREVAPCGDGPWGDIPVDGTTQHVDGTYAGGDSDGTAARPFPTIGEAVAAAAPGGLVAVAAGSYVETVRISAKPVRLWGRCPALVEIVGTEAYGAVDVRKGADGAEIRDLALRGSHNGIFLSGSTNVVADRVWIHQPASRGVSLETTFGPSSIEVSRSLIEGATGFGVITVEATVTLRESVVRDTQPTATQNWGRGVSAERDQSGSSTVTVLSSVFERNHEVGIYVDSSTALVEGSVVRDTFPAAGNPTSGMALSVVDMQHTGSAADVTVRSSLFERSHSSGVWAAGTTLMLEGVTVRGTLPRPTDNLVGRGITLQSDHVSAVTGNGIVRSSVIEGNHDLGIFVAGASLALETSIIRDTLPRVADGLGGRCLSIQRHPFQTVSSAATVLASVLERCFDCGVLVNGGSATFEASVVRQIQPEGVTLASGAGIIAQDEAATGVPSQLSLRACLIEDVYEYGLLAMGTETVVDQSTIRGTRPSLVDGYLGDGLAVAPSDHPFPVWVTGCQFDSNSRVGVATFGLVVAIGGSTLSCNAVDLNTETSSSGPGSFDDLGGNACGCQEAETCAARSSDLAPPEPLEPDDA